MRTPHRKLLLPLVAAGFALALTTALTAADAAPSDAAATPVATAPAPTGADSDGLAGLKVGKDAATGQLRPTTAAEDAELARQLREFWARYPRHSAKTQGATGATSLVIAPHSISLSVVTLDAAGRPVWDCVDDPDHVLAKLQQLRAQSAAASVSAPAEEK